jgi:hypothetical protein
VLEAAAAAEILITAAEKQNIAFRKVRRFIMVMD